MKRDILKQALKKRYKCIRLYTSSEIISINSNANLRVYEDYVFFDMGSKEVYIDNRDIKKIELELFDSSGEDINQFIGSNKW